MMFCQRQTLRCLCSLDCIHIAVIGGWVFTVCRVVLCMLVWLHMKSESSSRWVQNVLVSHPMQIYLNIKMKMRTFILLSFCFPNVSFKKISGHIEFTGIVVIISLRSLERVVMRYNLSPHPLKSIVLFNNIVLFSNSIFLCIKLIQ